MFIDAVTDTEQVGWRVWGGSGARVGPAGFVTSIVELCLCKLHNTYMFYILNNGLSSRTELFRKAQKRAKAGLYSCSPQKLPEPWRDRCRAPALALSQDVAVAPSLHESPHVCT